MPASNDRLYQKKPGGTFYGWYYLPDGSRTYVCTWCRDRKAAAAALRRLEREAQGSAGLSKNEAVTLETALTKFLSYTREVKRRSPETLRSYTVKAGHLVRLLASDSDINEFKTGVEEGYIVARRAEGASDNTIHHELIVLRAALKRSARLGLFTGSLERLRADHSPGYVPRRRFLTPEEYGALLRVLPEKRRTTVAFMVLTAARDSEWRSVTRAHVDLENALVLPGTKTTRSWRRLPLKNSPDLLALMKSVLTSGPKTGPIFSTWTNIRRDLRVGCAKAGIDPVSPNDLRRTFATWCWQGGMHPSRIALLLGHRDSRMVERVYGVLDSATLGNEVAAVFGPLMLPSATNLTRPRLRVVPRD